MKQLSMIGGIIATAVMTASAVLPTVGVVKDIAGNSYNIEQILSQGFSIIVLKENTW